VIGLDAALGHRPLNEVLALTSVTVETIHTPGALIELMARRPTALYIAWLLSQRQSRADRLLAAISRLDAPGRLATMILDCREARSLAPCSARNASANRINFREERSRQLVNEGSIDRRAGFVVVKIWDWSNERNELRKKINRAPDWKFYVIWQGQPVCLLSVVPFYFETEREARELAQCEAENRLVELGVFAMGH